MRHKIKYALLRGASIFNGKQKKIEVDVERWQKLKQLKWWIDFCCTFVKKKKNYEIQVIKR